MKTLNVNKDEQTLKKPIGRFKSLQEFADFKTNSANKMLSKIDNKLLQY